MSTPLDCATAEQMISNLIVEGLSDADLGELGEHLDDCPHCRKNAVDAFKTDRALSEMAAEDRIVPLRDRIRERLSITTPAGEKTVSLRSSRNKTSGWFRTFPLGLAAALVVVLLGAVLLLANRTKNDSETIAKVTLESNDIIVESGKTLTLNAEEFFGRKILTREDATALISFTDGTQVELDSETQVRLAIADRNKGKEIELYTGRLGVSASPQPKDRPLQIKSPHGTVSVVGTQFLLDVAQDSTSIGLLEGKVNLTRHGDNATLQLLAGQRATLAPEVALVATPLRRANDQLWTPADIATSAWYDADDESTIVGPEGLRNKNGAPLGVRVLEWRDKSGNNHHLFARGPGNAHIRKTSNLNSIIRFGAAAPNLQNTESICTQPFSFAIVEWTSKLYRNEAPFFDGIGAQRSRIFGSGNKITMDAGLSGPSLKKGTSPSIITGVFNGASSVLQINGGAPAFGDTGSGDLSQGITIGRSVDSDPNSPLGGNIGEIIIIPGVWSAAEQQRVEGYLAHKWGIRLPAKHPYKTTPPQKQ